MTIPIGVRSEVTDLELIVTSPPGSEFEAMVPENLGRNRRRPDGALESNPDYLLFDDLVLLSEMEREHALLRRAITAVTGEEGHFTFRDLLLGTLAEGGVSERVIDDCVELDRELYGVPSGEGDEAARILHDMDAANLAEALITGREPHGRRRRLLRWPLPNVLFARDLAAVVGNAIVITHAAEAARRRDMHLMRCIVTYHPLLSENDRIDLADEAPIRPTDGPALTIEGGDIEVLSDEVVLVGVSMRTSMAAVERLAPHLFQRGFRAVLAVQLPVRRSSMHIDTMFTQIDSEHGLVFPPFILDPEGLGVRIRRFTPEGVRDVGADFMRALRDVGVDLIPVYCGGSDPVSQAREQWSDGANAFALAPGVIIGYGRNTRTMRELSRIGYEIVTPEYFAWNALLYTGRPDLKVVVALEGSELVRGRGGPRCLTLPLRRGPRA